MFKSQRLLLLFSILLFACKQTKKEFSVEQVPDPMQHGGYVSNPDHIISEGMEQQLNTLMDSLDKQGRAQVAVVLLETIGEKVPKDIAHELFRYWKPGQKEKNNGLLVLLVNDQRRIEFETGYGLEGDLPDVVCYRIQQQEMLPHFREKDYDAGLWQGMRAVISVLQQQDAIAGNSAAQMIVPQELKPQAAPDEQENEQTPLHIAPLIPGQDNEPISVEIPQNANTLPYAELPYTLEQDYPQNSQPRETPGIGTIVLYVFYCVFSMFLFTGLINKNKKKKNQVVISSSNNTADTVIDISDITPPELFKTGKWARFWVFFLPGIVIIGFAVFTGYSFHWWTAPAILYGNWLIFAIFRTLVINIRAARRSSSLNRHQLFELLNAAHKNLLVPAFCLPLPMFFYRKWHTKRMDHLRHDPYACEKCNNNMMLLSEKAENKYLQKAQIAEEKEKSIDYDVWLCKGCEHTHILAYENIYSLAENCPACGHKTYRATKSVVVHRATTRREGEGLQYYECKFCDHLEKVPFVIPVVSSGSSGSSGSSSSSSGSSSSSSWGGGSSGGGGAGSSW